MPLQGMQISKLGIQATASGEVVHGLMCLKVSLPRDIDQRQASRWALFNASPPKTVSTPTILPLPLPIHQLTIPRSSSSSSAKRSRSLRTASRLLSLPPLTSYPPQSPSYLGAKPFLDVSSTTGQVHVVVDAVGGRRPTTRKADTGGARQDWLIVMEFETRIDHVAELIGKTILSIPKCLDNVIRFQIASSPSAMIPDPGEVSITTEPKMLPLPASSFLPLSSKNLQASNVRPKPERVESIGVEEDWEDGEDLGPDGAESEESEDEPYDESSEDGDETGGMWLEGRFQGTDTLRLEWQHSDLTLPDSPFLDIRPLWDRRHPCIHLEYTGHVTVEGETVVPVEISIPEFWGWSELEIGGDGLTHWQSADGEYWDSTALSAKQDRADTSLDVPDQDDSFSTIRRRARTPAGGVRNVSSTLTPVRSSASLMHQTAPAPIGVTIDDYSFEMNSLDNGAVPLATTSRSSTPCLIDQKAMQRLRPPNPMPGRLFDLAFQSDRRERQFVIRGILVPLSALTLVNSAQPVNIPVVRIDEAYATPSHSVASCPFAVYVGTSVPTSETHRYSTRDIVIGKFSWHAATDRSEAMIRSSAVRGTIKVVLQRNMWGIITMSVLVPSSKRATEIGFTVDSRGGNDLKILRTTMSGHHLPRSLYVGDETADVRIGVRGGGTFTSSVEIVLELAEGAAGTISLPFFANARGSLEVELKGDGWRSLNPSELLQKKGTNHYTLELPTSTPAYFSRAPHSPTVASRFRASTLLSRTSLFNLFMLWLVVSMAQRIQRLRTEVAFVAEEARDLRLYGLGSHILTNPTEGPSPLAHQVVEEHELNLPDVRPEIRIEPDSSIVAFPVAPREEIGLSTALGRVVWTHSAWERWASHPTVRTLERSLEWVWRAVVWLIVPN